MLSVDENGSKTIPSVVSFIPTSATLDDNQQTSKNDELSLPPWTITSTSQSPLNNNLQWPSNQYEIQTGKAAIQYENLHPKSTYRNVKRIIGTGGTMANLASGVVPNLYIDSINGHVNSGMSGGGSSGVGGGNGELDILFNMLEDSDKSSSKKNKKKKKQKGKWKKRKENELPKLHKQLLDAKDDPALLLCSMMSGSVDGSGVVGSGGESSSQGSISSEEGILLRPEQISACILRHLYDTAEQYHRTSLNSNKGKEVKVTRAVIGVPAYFTEAQRQATIHASEIAGVSKVKLLPEPEAAALAYGSSSTSSSNDMNKMYNDNEELILVFDLGGGTFDVSILEVGGGITEVMATIGNNRLGGTDFDKRVAEYLCSCAVDFDRKMKKNKKRDDDSLDGIDDIDKNRRQTSSRKRQVVKDWYRHGSGEVPDIILRVAEEVRKCLSNQKVVEVVVPLTEDGWKRVGCDESLNNQIIIGTPIDKTTFETEYNMIEDEDYTIISLDRTTFESICYNELQLLLQPIREVAIMAGVLLPGEARPSFVENAMLMAKEREEAMSVYNDGEDFWDFDEDNFEDEPLIKSSNTKRDTATSSKDKDTLNEQTMQQIQAMDIKSQKKAQQRGRKKARDIDKRERSFRKQKRSAMEEATTASLLGKQVDGGNNKRKGGGNSLSSSQSTSSVSVGNEKVQEGIHGRPLSRIVLVGGATRMPVIAKLLEAVVGMVPQRTVHPDEAVALGCAVQVGILDGENEGLLGGMQAVLSPMQAAVMRALGE